MEEINTATFKYYLVLLSKNMKTICVKFEAEFVRRMERVMKEHGYATKSEFIRESIRNFIKELEKNSV